MGNPFNFNNLAFKFVISHSYKAWRVYMCTLPFSPYLLPSKEAWESCNYS